MVVFKKNYTKLFCGEILITNFSISETQAKFSLSTATPNLNSSLYEIFAWSYDEWLPLQLGEVGTSAARVGLSFGADEASLVRCGAVAFSRTPSIPAKKRLIKSSFDAFHQF